jgi:hypothetical protein
VHATFGGGGKLPQAYNRGRKFFRKRALFQLVNGFTQTYVVGIAVKFSENWLILIDENTCG